MSPKVPTASDLLVAVDGNGIVAQKALREEAERATLAPRGRISQEG